MARRSNWLWIPFLFAFLVVALWASTSLLNRWLAGSGLVGSDSVLEVSLSGQIVERPLELFGSRAIGPLSVREIDSALRQAADDDRVSGVLLDIGPLATGFAKAQEIRAAIHAFRESGKPVVALLEIGTLADVYVAAAADTVIQIPSGNLILGLVSRTQYYTGLLDRLGVGVDVFHTGPYKTAGNPYTETEMSPEERAALESLLGSIYEQLLEDIAADRGISTDEVAAVIDRGLLSGDEAVAGGLVDRLGFRDEARALAGSRGSGTPLSVRAYRRGTVTPVLPLQPSIALIHVDGMMVPGETGDSPFGTRGLAGGETIARYLRQARESADVRAVLVRVDSPGGAVTAADVMLRELELTAAEKPVIVSMSDVAASGGYWLATGATRVYADPATFTGSIGVVSTRFNLAGTYEKLDIGNSLVKRGANADLFVDSERLDDGQRQILQDSVERHYRTFLTRVAEARGMTTEQVEDLAAGRVWTGRQALELGLVDDLGGFREALESARRAGGIGLGDDYALRVYPEDPSLFDGFLGMLGGIVAPEVRAVLAERPQALDAIQARLALLERLSSAGHAWALSLGPVPTPAR